MSIEHCILSRSVLYLIIKFNKVRPLGVLKG